MAEAATYRSTRHERDYLERTIETVRNHQHADNCWPQWANIFADEIERLWQEVERYELARREDAERLDRACRALGEIEGKARWYAENDVRDPQEVDHALCVEILDLAQRAFDA